MPVRGLACAALAVLLGAAGCDPPTRHEALSALVDGVPPYEQWAQPTPRPPRPRRITQPVREEKPPPPKVAVRLELQTGKAGFPDTWEALTEALPKDATDEVDWSAAIANGLIDPRNTIPPAPPEEQTVLELDVVLGDTDNPMHAVLPHAAHTRWLACDSCHPDLYPMESGKTHTDMAEINDGKSCGICHGTVAFPATSCARCHPAMEGG